MFPTRSAEEHWNMASERRFEALERRLEGIRRAQRGAFTGQIELRGMTKEDEVFTERTKQRMHYPEKETTLHPRAVGVTATNQNDERFGRVECLSGPMPVDGTRLRGEEMLGRRILSMGA